MVVLDTFIGWKSNADICNFNGEYGNCRCVGLFFLVVAGLFDRLHVGSVVVYGCRYFVVQSPSIELEERARFRVKHPYQACQGINVTFFKSWLITRNVCTDWNRNVSDSRQERRIKKRLSVKFGHDKLEHLGYLSDFSSQGFFVESRIVYKSGVVLNFELTTRDGEIILIEGRVQWSKKGAPRLNHIMKSGMGIFILNFLQGVDVYLSLDDLIEKSASCW